MINRELDVLIAEKVFGAKVIHVNQKHGWRVDYLADKDECNEGVPTDAGWEGFKLKYYSHKIEHAWDVVEALTKDGWQIDTLTSEHGGTDVILKCTVGARGRFYSDVMEGNYLTFSEAVCSVALKAMKAYPIEEKK